MSDESRKKILARRASFVAAALASVACGKDAAERPEPCLSVPYNYGHDGSTPPQPCLSVPVADPRLTLDASSAAPSPTDGGTVIPDAGVDASRSPKRPTTP